jgi:hypothetical protein
MMLQARWYDHYPSELPNFKGQVKDRNSLYLGQVEIELHQSAQITSSP